MRRGISLSCTSPYKVLSTVYLIGSTIQLLLGGLLTPTGGAYCLVLQGYCCHRLTDSILPALCFCFPPPARVFRVFETAHDNVSSLLPCIGDKCFSSGVGFLPWSLRWIVDSPLLSMTDDWFLRHLVFSSGCSLLALCSASLSCARVRRSLNRPHNHVSSSFLKAFLLLLSDSLLLWSFDIPC
jgi:hypothetical protein